MLLPLVGTLVLADAINMTVYRITPRNYTGLANMDSGDAAGDVYFGLYEVCLQSAWMACQHVAEASTLRFASAAVCTAHRVP